MNPQWLTVKVASKQLEATDIFGFELVDPSGAKLPAFEAGAHIDIEVAPGLVRQYSLCNAPGETHRYQVAILRDPNTRGGSKGMHDKVTAGQTIRISAPRNHFPLASDGKRHLLIGGGIGVTPILCMAEQLAKSGGNFEMHYCSRSADRMAFKDRIRQSPFSDRVAFHFDDGAADQKFDIEKVLANPAPGVHLYVCGPTGFMDWVLATAKAKGWPEPQVHREYFSGAEVSKEGNEEFEVKLAKSGKVFKVPADKTIAEVLLANGYDLPLSCEQGVCGTCLTNVLEGIPEHKDIFLTDAERAKNDQMLPCCSRSKTPLLVLDL